MSRTLYIMGTDMLGHGLLLETPIIEKNGPDLCCQIDNVQGFLQVSYQKWHLTGTTEPCP